MEQIKIFMVALLLLLSTVNCKEDSEDDSALAALVILAGNRSTTGATAVDAGDSTTTFTLGGTVTNLGEGKTIVLTNEGVDKTITSNGSYTFDEPVNIGATYKVTVKTQPVDHPQCFVRNGEGVANSNVTDINVSCEEPD